MPIKLTLHHYAFLTNDTNEWLKENENLIGKPFNVEETKIIHSQKVNITFVEQHKGETLIELVEPWKDNSTLQKMISKGITIYHRGYTVSSESFQHILKTFEEKGGHVLPAFHSEAFNGLRCAFIITSNIGLIEIIEQ